MKRRNNIEYPVAQIREWIEIDGKTQQWIADELQKSLDPRVTAKLIYKVCKKHQIKCQRTGPRAGEGHPEWKGGRIVNKDGYVQVYAPDHPTTHRTKKYVLEHRLVMEKHLGRYLTRDEVVHHRNGQKDDNRLENLELFSTNGEHLRETLKGQCPKWSEDGLRRIKEGQKNRRAPSPSKSHRATCSRIAQTLNTIGLAIGRGAIVSKKEASHHLVDFGISLEQAFEMEDAQLRELLGVPPHQMRELQRQRKRLEREQARQCQPCK